jgi:glycosyltransferase involved in cell wall biosynthesis
MPMVSVIMSVFNGEKYLSECIESILSQTHKNIEFLITNDCSTDNTDAIIQSYGLKDQRIKIIQNEKNIGLTKSLNNMLDTAVGEYIARMDADDISLPRRFEKQVQFMRTNPDIGVCGVNSIKVGESSRKGSRRSVFNHEEIKAVSLFSNAMQHPSTMIRGDLFSDKKFRYNEEFHIIQDYELWQRLIKVTKFHVLKDICFKYRSLESSVTSSSAKKKNYREKYLLQIYKYALSDFGLEASADELTTHYNITSNYINDTYENIDKVYAWLSKMKETNYKNNYFEPKIFNRVISSYWLYFCTRSTSLGPGTFLKYVSSDLMYLGFGNFKSTLKLFAKSSIKYRASSERNSTAA